MSENNIKYKLSLKKYFAFFITLIVISCGPSKTYLAGVSTYDEEVQMWDPGYRVYHTSDSKSRIYFIIPSGSLLFVKNPETSKFEASAEIVYQIIKSGNNSIIDRGEIKIKREENKIPTEAFIGYFDINLPDNSYYYAGITLNDNKRKKQFEEIITIDKKNKDSRENFIITDTTNRVLFLDYANSKIMISSERNPKSTYFVTKFELISDYPFPIYVERNLPKTTFKKDTTFTIASDAFIKMDNEGIYHITKEQNSAFGLTLFNFYDGFPLIAQKKNMAPPMRYITSDEEFNDFPIGSDRSKLNAEKIWAEMSSDLPKAEKLITTYFKRVQYSNLYYTSYKEGWRTDRGLVYTIFGQPSSTIKTTTSEKWTYGQNSSSLSIEFVFNKTNNPFTYNDFTLIRDDNKKEIWKKAIEYWRSGKVFNVYEINRIIENEETQRRNRNNMWYPNYRY